MTQIPDKVYAIGLIRPYGEVSPIRDEDTGVGISPLSIEDAVGERVVPTFSTRAKARWGMNNFMSKDERAQNAICLARVDLGELLEALRPGGPAGSPKVHYIGVNMGKGGVYPLIRL
jgi:hypothetical protein